ncbi:MAG: short-chain fatty acyl-CoA regulator family protein [Candidatus Sedimenticola endophacoides]
MRGGPCPPAGLLYRTRPGEPGGGGTDRRQLPRVCERRDCPQRAFPPLSRRLSINENSRSAYPYPFEETGDGQEE